MTRRLIMMIGLLIATGVCAEEAAQDTVRAADSSMIKTVVDTLLFVAPTVVSPAAEVTNPVDFEKHLYQNPTVALFKSLLVPGLGQLGNHRYFKAILFAGLESWFIVSAVHYGKQAADAKPLYLDASDAGVRDNWYRFYDNKRKNRNKFIWYAGLTAFLSMFDAYVDAHLSGSPIEAHNEKFGFEVTPLEAGGINASLTYSF